MIAVTDLSVPLTWFAARSLTFQGMRYKRYKHNTNDTMQMNMASCNCASLQLQALLQSDAIVIMLPDKLVLARMPA